MSMEFVRNHYKVPAKRGGRVKYDGRLGTIKSATYQIKVQFDGSKGTFPIHPTHENLEYLD